MIAALKGCEIFGNRTRRRDLGWSSSPSISSFSGLLGELLLDLLRPTLLLLLLFALTIGLVGLRNKRARRFRLARKSALVSVRHCRPRSAAWIRVAAA
jgi:hypothetical protein